MLPLRRRHNFTLIEVLIAFGLVAILVATLMGFYWQMNRLQIESDQIRRQAFQLRYLQSRLAEVLPRAVPPTQLTESTSTAAAATSNKKVPSAFFYTSDREDAGVLSSPSLVFSYDNGTDLDPLFCNVVLGRLYRVEKDGRGELWLATWPRPGCSMNAALARKELLMPNVSRIAFECYQPPKLVQETSVAGTVAAAKEAVEGPPENTWVTNWQLAYQKLPAMIKLTVTLQAERGAQVGEELTFYFPFPNFPQPITIIQ